MAIFINALVVAPIVVRFEYNHSQCYRHSRRIENRNNEMTKRHDRKKKNMNMTLPAPPLKTL